MYGLYSYRPVREGRFSRALGSGTGCGACTCVSQTHAREAGVTVRANYVALPFAAGRGQDEGGEIPPDQGAPRPSCPGSTVPSPKIAAMERRKAMRFRSSSCRKRCRERNDIKVRLAALHAPRCYERRNSKLTSRDARERMRMSFVGANGASPRACCLKIESGMRNDARRFNTHNRHHRA